MKTARFTSAIATLGLVLFMSIASIANSGQLYTGDLPRSGDKSMNISNASEKDLSYLRFDVTRYSNENEETYMVNSSLNYLRFDVNNYISNTESEAIELPVSNEFEYLRFDVNNFNESNTESMNELPVKEFDYIRFDVNNFASAGNNAIDELPVTE